MGDGAAVLVIFEPEVDLFTDGVRERGDFAEHKKTISELVN